VKVNIMCVKIFKYPRLLLGIIPFMLRSIVILLKTGFVHRVPFTVASRHVC
jgi:hypothetical protein